MNTLLALETAIARDLDILDYPKKDWVVNFRTKDNENILDVLIIGGGQGGLSLAFGLIRERVKNILVVDQNPKGFFGPWKNFARMITLRTPKYVIGPEQGISNLSIRAWYEAKYGQKAWDDLHLIPKEDWADYLSWYQEVLRLPVMHEAKVLDFSFCELNQCFLVRVESDGLIKNFWAKKVVLANGIEGSGEWHTPDYIKNALDKNSYAHTCEEINFSKLKGKDVAVFGAGASAFDAASEALEAGASSVKILFRRKTLPRVNPYRWAEFSGFLNHHASLSDEEKYSFIQQIIAMGQLPPADTFMRASKFQNFFLEPGCEINHVENGPKIKIHTQRGEFLADFLILGTGFKTDLSRRPELVHVEPYIARWKDRIDKERSNDLLEYPYLGQNFQFLEKSAGQAPYVSSIFCYNFGCLLSLGFGGASISGMKYSLKKLIFGITEQLYQENAKHYFATLKDFAIEEF
jgi:cation diffusion facilitator CzcD-associated flavoprotein CzcO